MNKKILHIISSLDLGGCENILFNFLNFDISSRSSHLIISLNPDGIFKKS